MKRFSDKIGPFSIALAFLMPVAIESALLAEVVPEVLIGEREGGRWNYDIQTEPQDEDDDIQQLKKEAKKW